MELNTFALVIAIAGTIMAFPTNPLEDVEPASDPPHHSIPFHPTQQSHTAIETIVLRLATRKYLADLAAPQLDTFRLGKRGSVLNRES
ncbi:hypothetical protein LTR94_017442 [Friedmanniomyces endolithicus]|nr:hypothetical protein LTR94_017442 [Friedmanniomyces endolithicus]